MKNQFKSLTLITTVLALTLCFVAEASTPAPPPLIHIRGSVQSIDAKTITVTTANGPVKIALASGYKVMQLIRASKSSIKPGSFLGITSVAQPDGSQRAVEIHVFPPAMRGAGEGSYPWDYPGATSTGGSKMTNGTVSQSNMAGAAPASKMTNGTVSGSSASSLTLTYKGIGGAGSQNLIIPRGIPVVTFHPGTPIRTQAW